MIPIAEGLTPLEGSNYYASVVASQVVTTSRGTVAINSTETSTSPLINQNLMSTKADQELFVATFRRPREVFAASGLMAGPELIPGPMVQSNAEISAFLNQIVGLFQHAQGTCAMGLPSNPDAAVDSKARVFSVQGLRVVDASVCPFSLPGFPTANVYMIAENICAGYFRRRDGDEAILHADNEGVVES